MISIDDTQTPPKTNIRVRRDGMALTPTCEIPLKMCCGAVLLGEECGCGPGEFGEYFDKAIVWDLTAGDA